MIYDLRFMIYDCFLCLCAFVAQKFSEMHKNLQKASKIHENLQKPYQNSQFGGSI